MVQLSGEVLSDVWWQRTRIMGYGHRSLVREVLCEEPAETSVELELGMIASWRPKRSLCSP